MKLIEQLNNKILVLDGATGTAIQKYNLEDSCFLGNKGCNEIFNITKPEVIKEIHLKYIESGAELIETNSFNSNRISLIYYNIEDTSYEFAKRSGEIAFDVRDE